MQNSACASPVSGGLPSLCDTETASPEYHSGNVTPTLMDASISPRGSVSPLLTPERHQLKHEQQHQQQHHHHHQQQHIRSLASIPEYVTQKEISLWKTEAAYHPYDPNPIPLPVQIDQPASLPNTPKTSPCHSPEATSQRHYFERQPISPALSLKRSYSQAESLTGNDFESDYKHDEDEAEEEEDGEEEEDDDDDEEDDIDEDEDDGSDDYDDTMPLKPKHGRVQTQAGKKSRKNYSKDITRTLMNWYLTNNGLLPDQDTKARLAGLTNKTPIQISTWYQNARRRHHLKLKRFQSLSAQNPDLVHDYESLMSYLKEQKVKHAKRPSESKRSRRRCK
ncbi:hypothetical protein Unana1_02004 [Umbelopsis nana]